ncbi:MAG: extracellular solute-binding protein [Spirochaetales bacterium]|nr:extracellular solute-binding protein [Spirochaetales bacterium]
MKKFMSLISMLLLGGVLFGAGQQDAVPVDVDPVASATEAGTPGAPVQLRALIGSWNTMASSVESRKEYYEQAILAWAEEHPDVYVEIEGIPGGQTAQAMTKLITAAIAGNPHDFANIDSQWVGNFHEAGVLSPIDDYLTQEDKDQFFDFTKIVTVRDGKQYNLWAETGLLLYYYNTDYVKVAPRTWDDVFALNDTLKAEGIDKDAFLTQGKGAAAAFCLLPSYWAQGAVLFDAADNYRPVFGEGKNRDAMINSFSFIKELVDAGAMPSEMIGYDHNELEAEAKADNVASFIAGSWKQGGLDPEKWEYTSLPSMDGSKSNIYGGWTFGFLARDKKKLEESVNFVNAVYTSRDAMADRLPRHGYIPVRKDVFSAEAFKSPFYEVIYKELEVGRARPATSMYPEVESLIEEAMGKILSGSDVAETVDEMYSKVVRSYNAKN